MQYRRRWALAAIALFVASMSPFILRTARQIAHRDHSATSQGSATAAHSRPEPVLPLPTFEREPSLDTALIPRLRMPFPAGTVVLCAQGNHAKSGLTHALPQNLHALDFSNRTLSEVTVVAAASGSIAYVVSNAGTDESAGGGYGNQVRVLHEHGVFTLYAHLDRVLVRVGQSIAAGQTLGTMGRTGFAGDRHLHLSLHQGAIDQEGVPDTLEIPALVTYEADANGGFAPRTSGEFRCSSANNPWSGSLYASENDGKSTVIGAAPEALARQVQSAQAILATSVQRRSRLWEVSKRTARLTRTQYRRFLEPLMSEDPDDPVTQYTWAVEVELTARRIHSANAHLDRAARALKSPALFEPWLGGWIEARRGSIALAEGHADDAKRHFDKARQLLPIAEIEEYERAEWEQWRQ